MNRLATRTSRLDEVGNANASSACPKMGSYEIALNVVERHDHRRARESPSRSGSARRPRSRAKLVRGDDRGDVGLIVVEEAPRRVGMILALAANQAVARPAEEALAELAAQQDLPAVGAALALLDQRLGERAAWSSALRATRSSECE